MSSVDCFLTFMIETDAQAEEIPLYCEEYGVTSFKLYMQARRIPAADHNWPSRRAGLGVGIDDGTLYLVMEQVARYGAPAICSIHPENWEIARVFERRLRELGHDDLAAWTDRSPHMLEAQHVRAYAYVAEQLGARMYIQHATTPETFERDPRGPPPRGRAVRPDRAGLARLLPVRRLAHQRAPALPRHPGGALAGPGPGRRRRGRLRPRGRLAPGRPRVDVPPEHLGLPDRASPGSRPSCR